MAITLDRRRNIPKYEILVDQIKNALAEKQYPDGFKLSPERELAEQFDVSVMTLRKSLNILEGKGIISREHGRGTFVGRSSWSRNGAESTTEARSVAFVLIDKANRNDPYEDMGNRFYTWLLGAVDAKLAEYNRHLIVTHTCTEHLAAGRMPKAIEQNEVAGIILDGYVDDFHVEHFKRMGLPLVVLGSHNLQVPATTVSTDITKFGYLMSESLLKRKCGPLFLGIEPLRLPFTRQLMEGYVRACREAGQDEQIYLFATGAEDCVVVERMAEHAGGSFSLLLAYNAAYALVEMFRERKLSLAEYPVAVYGHADVISSEMRRRLNVDSGCSELAPQLAVELIEKLIGGEPVESVCLEPEITAWEDDGELRMDVSWIKGKSTAPRNGVSGLCK